MPELAYVNGSFCPIAEATVRIEDRGFQFGDGVYEVLVYYGDRPLMLEAHLQRLSASCRGICLEVDFDELNLREVIEEGVRRAGLEVTMVYVQLTRGPAPREHRFPEHFEPTVVMTFRPKPAFDPQKRAQGLSVTVMPDFRWKRCDLKTLTLLPNVLAKNEALARGFDDALFVGPDGDVRESTAANVFIIHKGHLLTRPTDETILPGITRDLVIRCAENIDLPVRETRFTCNDLIKADEAFLCSTVIDIVALVQVDDHLIGAGCPGSTTAALYEEMLKSYRK